MLALTMFTNDIFLQAGISAIADDVNNVNYHYTIRVFVLDEYTPFDNLLEIKTIAQAQDHILVLSDVISKEGVRRMLAGVAHVYVARADMPPGQLRRLMRDLLVNGVPCLSRQANAPQRLSYNERTVLQCLCCGDSPAKISRRLRISEKTVSRYKLNALQSLGLSDNISICRLKSASNIQKVLSFF